MKDILFLMGAGASYGAGSVVPEPPPLGFQLFEELKRSYPSSWGRFPIEIQEKFRSDFEDGMGFVFDNYGQAIPQLMREMAAYFIQFRPHNRRTLYCRLITDLKNRSVLRRTVFSTLNYECVLEFSLLENGYGISYFDEGQNGQIPVWKLHGSCNMFCHDIQAGLGITYGTGVTWEGGIQAFLDPNRVIQHCLLETALAPVMCLYMKGKVLNVSPSSVRQLQEAWKEKVQAASVVIIIGVRPLVEDKHIWEPLANTSAPVLFVGTKSLFDEWQGAYRRRPTEYLGNRFNEVYPELVRRLQAYEPKRF